MKSRQLIENDRVGRWWKTKAEKDMTDEEIEAAAQERIERGERQAQNLARANVIGKMEPQSQQLVDLVHQRDSLLKERQARVALEKEMTKLGLNLRGFRGEFIMRRPGHMDRMIHSLGLGAAEAGDIIGVRVKGNPLYFSRPIKRHPSRS